MNATTDPTPPLPEQPPTPPPPEPHPSQFRTITLTIILTLGAVALAYGVYHYAPKPPSAQRACTMEAKVCPDSTSVGRSGPKCEFTPCPTAQISPTPAGTANWKIYTNKKHGYSINYPTEYLSGFADVITGVFSQSNGTENQLDILQSEADKFNNFIQIQVSDVAEHNKKLPELVNEIYQKQKEHPQTTTISPLIQSTFNGIADFEYTFSSNVFYTLSWSGVVTPGSYKTILFQKDTTLYAFYLKNTDIFNRILSTFKFIETDAQAKTDTCTTDIDCGLNSCSCTADLKSNLTPNKQMCARYCEGNPKCVNKQCVLVK